MIRQTLLTVFKPRNNFWLIRFNLVVIRDMRCVELTFGLLGYGVLAQAYYGAHRAVGGAA